MMRMLPYRTADDVISGVVMTFTDITRISAAEARINQLARDLRSRIGELETILDLIPVGVMITGIDGTPNVLVNSDAAHLLGADNSHRGLKPGLVPFRLFEGAA